MDTVSTAVTNLVICSNQFNQSPLPTAARLTETMLLGNIELLREGERAVLEYDGANMRFTNDEAANAYLEKDYRPGFGLV